MKSTTIKNALAFLGCFCASGLAMAAGGDGTADAAVVPVRVANPSTVPGPDANFSGRVRVTTPFQSEGPGQASGATVTFDAGARTAWHTHPHGQVLVVVAGIGLVQRDGQPAVAIRPGEVVNIPAGARHWHGAGPAGPMTHVAIAEKLAGVVVAWQEKLDDKAYEAAAVAAGLRAGNAAPDAPSRAQQLMGDVAPKLAELTDGVLFADVWERSALSKRDRSLATVSALIAMNRPEQLRSHLALGMQNGLTQAELTEVITHLAFYAGWPNAITAVGVARPVFNERR